MLEGKVVSLTSHTLAPVPCAIGGTGLPAGVALRGVDDMPEAGLGNVAATIFNLMGYQVGRGGGGGVESGGSSARGSAAGLLLDVCCCRMRVGGGWEEEGSADGGFDASG